MRNSRKQSHHFEFSFLLMGWVIWERQCGSTAKEPTGIQKAEVWISVTLAAAMVTLAGGFLPLDLKFSPWILGFMPQNHIPRMFIQGHYMWLCRLYTAQGCQLRGWVGAEMHPILHSSICAQWWWAMSTWRKGHFFSTLHKSTIWASEGL